MVNISELKIHLKKFLTKNNRQTIDEVTKQLIKFYSDDVIYN